MDGTERWFDRLSHGLWKGIRRVCGAGTHRYRRFGYLRPSQAGIAAAAGWEGTLWIHRGAPPFLKKLFADRGSGWSEEDLVEAVFMLGTLIHEAFHHVVPRGADPEADWRAYGRFLGEALEEGVTEAATRRLLPRVVKGMERSVPGLTRGLRSREKVYWNYVPAVQEMVGRIQALPGMRGRDVLMELARESPASKLPTLTRLYLEGVGLDRKLSARGRAECCRQMGEALRRLYEAPETRAWAQPPDRSYPSRVNSADPPGRSLILGMQALVEMELASSRAADREGLPMPDNWRVAMAKRAMASAEYAVKRSQDRPVETRDAARSWLQEASEDLDLAQDVVASSSFATAATFDRRADVWINHWRRSQVGRRRPRRSLEHSPAWRRELG